MGPVTTDRGAGGGAENVLLVMQSIPLMLSRTDGR